MTKLDVGRAQFCFFLAEAVVILFYGLFSMYGTFAGPLEISDILAK